MKASKSVLIAVAAPLFVYFSHIGRSEFHLAQGSELILAIEGYDPRDLLRGRYLQFSYSLAPGEADGERRWGMRRLNDSNCYTPSHSDAARPAELRPTPCTKTDTLKVWIHGSHVSGRQQFFLPEAKAKAVETHFLEHGGALRVKVLEHGKLVVVDLLIKGQPWRAFLESEGH
jgi:uncharacterized membrane-anchored protein